MQQYQLNSFKTWLWWFAWVIQSHSLVISCALCHTYVSIVLMFEWTHRHSYKCMYRNLGNFRCWNIFVGQANHKNWTHEYLSTTNIYIATSLVVWLPLAHRFFAKSYLPDIFKYVGSANTGNCLKFFHRWWQLSCLSHWHKHMPKNIFVHFNVRVNKISCV